MKQELSKERLQQVVDGDIFYTDEQREVARALLAGMEQEPEWLYREHNLNNGMKTGWELLDQMQYDILKETVDPETAEFKKIYTHPAPSIPAAVPESTRGKLAILQLASIINDLSLPDNVPFVEITNEIFRLKQLESPAPAVSDDLLSSMEEVLRISDRDHDAWNRAKSAIAACRAAMLQETQKSAGASNNCRSNEKVQVLASINSAPTLVSLPKNAESLPGNSPVIPDGWVPVSERMPDNADSVVTSNGFDIGRGWWDGDSWQVITSHDAVHGEITHWQPLPAAPKV